MISKTRIQRKCRHCGTWNKDEEYCTNCGNLLNPEKIRRKENAEKEKKRLLLRKPNQLDTWLENFSNSKNPLVKVLYHILNTVWIIFAAIGGFIIYIVAMVSG